MTLKIAAIPRQLGVVRYETINNKHADAAVPVCAGHITTTLLMVVAVGQAPQIERFESLRQYQ
jgi:hypothetical protein